MAASRANSAVAELYVWFDFVIIVFNSYLSGICLSVSLYIICMLPCREWRYYIYLLPVVLSLGHRTVVSLAPTDTPNRKPWNNHRHSSSSASSSSWRSKTTTSEEIRKDKHGRSLYRVALMCCSLAGTPSRIIYRIIIFSDARVSASPQWVNA